MSHVWADNHRCDLNTSSATEAQHVLDPKAKCLTCPSVNLVSTTNNNNDLKKTHQAFMCHSVIWCKWNIAEWKKKHRRKEKYLRKTHLLTEHCVSKQGNTGETDVEQNYACLRSQLTIRVVLQINKERIKFLKCPWHSTT